ncbi:MAG: ArsC family reductase [Limnohabitans sp.]|nr:MAG: ArsC family reductase [Limnohabitans sp.]
MKKTIVYGIPNCDSVKKARVWLSQQGLDFEFHDFKKQGVPEAKLEGWLQACGWEVVLNRKGTTWRQLDSATQAAVQDAASAKALMLQQASVIKRPVIEWPSGNVTVGYTPEGWPA